MKSIRSQSRKEPQVEPVLAPVPAPEVVPMSVEPADPKPATKGGPAEQLARIEEKAARIEEKFARQEAVFGRAQDSLDRAAERVEHAAKSVDAVELASEVAALRARVDKTPQMGALILSGLVTSAATVILLLAILKFFPGLLK